MLSLAKTIIVFQATLKIDPMTFPWLLHLKIILQVFWSSHKTPLSLSPCSIHWSCHPPHNIKDHNLPSIDDFPTPSTPTLDPQPMFVSPAPSPIPYSTTTTSNTTLPDTPPSPRSPTPPQTTIQTSPYTTPFHSPLPSASTSHPLTTSANNSSLPTTLQYPTTSPSYSTPSFLPPRTKKQNTKYVTPADSG